MTGAEVISNVQGGVKVTSEQAGAEISSGMVGAVLNSGADSMDHLFLLSLFYVSMLYHS